MKTAVICSYARSLFCFANKGELTKIRPDDLAAAVVKALVAQTKIDVNAIEDLILGCSFPEVEQGINIGRLIELLADLPISVASATINQFCGSSMTAIHMAVGSITSGAADVFNCGGIESMTRIPTSGFNPSPNPNLHEKCAGAYMSMGDTAENIARKYNITRAQQDQFTVNSQAKVSRAQAGGRYSDEIVPINVRGTIVDKDGMIRSDTTLDVLAGLKPAFDAQGTVTTGTSSPLTDGAAAVLVCSEDYARAHQLPILARIKSYAVSGCDPEIMGIGPVAATRKALTRAGLIIDDIDIVEINEAFASQTLACLYDLGIDQSKINLDGGAIALGHPLGATGARITGKAASLLKREGKKYALATQCIGSGQGIATILEAVS